MQTDLHVVAMIIGSKMDTLENPFSPGALVCEMNSRWSSGVGKPMEHDRQVKRGCTISDCEFAAITDIMVRVRRDGLIPDFVNSR